MEEVSRQYDDGIRIVQLMEWGRFKEAIEESEKYIQTYPEDASGYALLGNIFLAVGDYKKAIHWTEAALSRDPEHSIAWEVRIKVFYVTEKPKKVLEDIEAALVIYPEEIFYHYMKGILYYDLDKPKKVKECLETAFEIDPEDPHCLALYSAVLGELRDKKGSITAEKQALAIAPEDDIVLRFTAAAAEERGDYKAASDYIGTAIRLDPNSKEMRKAYITLLQHQSIVLRIFLFPINFFSKLNPWLAWPLWIVLWVGFKPLVLLFILLYIVSFWTTRFIVNKRVFGTLFGR